MANRPEPAAAEQDVSRRELRLVLVGLAFALTLASLDQNIVATALPRITGDLGGLQHLSWVVTSFVVASTVSAPLYGRSSDLYGRRPAFIVSITVFLIGSVLCGSARGMIGLIAFRAVQGLGAGGLIVLTQTVIGDLVSPRERGRYQGLFAGVFAACSVAGPLLGGLISEYASWRWIFYVNLPIGAVALGLIVLALPKRPPGGAFRLDLLGAMLLVAGTCCLLLVLSWGGNTYAWSSPTIIGTATASLVCFALLVPVEIRAEQPVLPPDLFANKVFLIGVTSLTVTSMALFGAVVFLPLMFQLLIGASPARAGLMISPMMAGVITASVVGGRVVTRTGRYKSVAAGGLLAASMAYMFLAWATQVGLGAWPLEAVLLVMGSGFGLVFPNLVTAIQNGVEHGKLGSATATAAFFRSLGGALGVALSGAILTHLHASHLGTAGASASVSTIAGLSNAQHAFLIAAYRSGLCRAFAFGAAIATLGLLILLFLPERPLRLTARASPQMTRTCAVRSARW